MQWDDSFRPTCLKRTGSRIKFHAPNVVDFDDIFRTQLANFRKLWLRNTLLSKAPSVGLSAKLSKTSKINYLTPPRMLALYQANVPMSIAEFVFPNTLPT